MRAFASILALLLLPISALAATSTGTDTLFGTYYDTPVFTDGSFSGTLFRDFTNTTRFDATLTVQVNSTSGVFDTAIRGYYTNADVDSVHPQFYVGATVIATVNGTTTGDWWVGPKITVNFDGYPDWYENYIVENSNRSIGVWDSTFTTNGNTYLGDTVDAGGETYKHYLYVQFAWKQYWAIRQTFRTSGDVAIKPILEFWRANGMPNKKIHEIRVGNVETSGLVDMQFVIDPAYSPLNWTTKPDIAIDACP